MSIPSSLAGGSAKPLYLATFLGILAVLLWATIAPYRGNVTALFHLDREFASLHSVLPGFVTLSIPGYDGMQYYQMARDIPALLSPHEWDTLRTFATPGPHAYQRILLPLIAFLGSFGTTRLLPYSFLAINVLSIVCTFLLILRWKNGNGLLAFALALSPAATIGLHFSLAEPLGLLLLTLFLLRYQDTHRISAFEVLLLSLLVCTREIFFVFLLAIAAWNLLHRQWKQSLLCLIPFACFVALQAVLGTIFGEIPFFISAAKYSFPFAAMTKILIGGSGFNIYTFSSIALFTLFVLPAFLLVTTNLIRGKEANHLIPWLLFLFLLLMLSMPDHIWGSITSIGRVITPVYPLFIVYAGMRGNFPSRLIALGILALGLGSGFGLASIHHPFFIS